MDILREPALWIFSIVWSILIVIGYNYVAKENDASCREKAALMQREYLYSSTVGCMLKNKDGTYIPLNNVRETIR